MHYVLVYAHRLCRVLRTYDYDHVPVYVYVLVHAYAYFYSMICTYTLFFELAPLSSDPSTVGFG